MLKICLPHLALGLGGSRAAAQLAIPEARAVRRQARAEMLVFGPRRAGQEGRAQLETPTACGEPCLLIVGGIASANKCAAHVGHVCQDWPQEG